MSEHGFTLIELLVIVAIISIIIAVLLPNLGHVRDKANGRAAQGYLYHCVNSIEQERDSMTLKLPTSITDCQDSDLISKIPRPASVITDSISISSTSDSYTITVESSNGSTYFYDGRAIHIQ